jgi:hypothetical protein
MSGPLRNGTVSISKKRGFEYDNNMVRVCMQGGESSVLPSDLLLHKVPSLNRVLHHNRKLISNDTACDICTDKLELGARVLAYCKTCGQNLHHECLMKWFEKRELADEERNCPYCRREWHVEDNKIPSLICDYIHPTGLSVYREWLYTSRVPIENLPNGKPNLLPLVYARSLSVAWEDNDFQKAVIHATLEIIVDTGVCFDSVAIHAAYQELAREDALGREDVFLIIIVDLYLLHSRRTTGRWLEAKSANKFPEQFLHDVAVAAVRERETGFMNSEMDLERMKAWYGRIAKLLDDSELDDGSLLEDFKHDDDVQMED